MSPLAAGFGRKASTSPPASSRSPVQLKFGLSDASPLATDIASPAAERELPPSMRAAASDAVRRARAAAKRKAEVQRASACRLQAWWRGLRERESFLRPLMECVNALHDFRRAGRLVTVVRDRAEVHAGRNTTEHSGLHMRLRCELRRDMADPAWRETYHRFLSQHTRRFGSNDALLAAVASQAQVGYVGADDGMDASPWTAFTVGRVRDAAAAARAPRGSVVSGSSGSDSFPPRPSRNDGAAPRKLNSLALEQVPKAPRPERSSVFFFGLPPDEPDPRSPILMTDMSVGVASQHSDSLEPAPQHANRSPSLSAPSVRRATVPGTT